MDIRFYSWLDDKGRQLPYAEHCWCIHRSGPLSPCGAKHWIRKSEGAHDATRPGVWLACIYKIRQWAWVHREILARNKQSKHSALIREVHGKMDMWNAFMINFAGNVWGEKSSKRSVNAVSWWKIGYGSITIKGHMQTSGWEHQMSRRNNRADRERFILQSGLRPSLRKNLAGLPLYDIIQITPHSTWVIKPTDGKVPGKSVDFNCRWPSNPYLM